jgi:hypothetical protein
MRFKPFKILKIVTSLFNKMKRQDIVNFESGQVVVSDPCYNLPISGPEGYQGIINLEPGKYIVNISYINDRISELEILKKGFNGSTRWEELIHDDICVDSGQCGFFDTDYYQKDQYYTNLDRISSIIIREDEPFYSICSDRTLSEDQWGIIPHGVVSSSGYGDGSYSLYGIYDKKNTDINRKLIGAALVFIDDIDEID